MYVTDKTDFALMILLREVTTQETISISTSSEMQL